MTSRKRPFSVIDQAVALERLYAQMKDISKRATGLEWAPALERDLWAIAFQSAKPMYGMLCISSDEVRAMQKHAREARHWWISESNKGPQISISLTEARLMFGPTAESLERRAPRACVPDIEVHDVIQADPDRCDWGPVFVVVTEVRDWGVLGYFLTDFNRGVPPGRAYLRLNHGDYERVGRAAWITGG